LKNNRRGGPCDITAGALHFGFNVVNDNSPMKRFAMAISGVQRRQGRTKRQRNRNYKASIGFGQDRSTDGNVQRCGIDGHESSTSTELSNDHSLGDSEVSQARPEMAST
jgi:hypothetical protein